MVVAGSRDVTLRSVFLFAYGIYNQSLLCFGLAALGEFMHPCEDDIVCKCTTDENKVPYFNAPVYLENKEQIGKVDEIFGQLRDFVSFSYHVNCWVGPVKQMCLKQ